MTSRASPTADGHDLRARHADEEVETLQPDTLNAAFGALTKRYGSFDRFMKDGLALSEQDLAALKAKFLEP